MKESKGWGCLFTNHQLRAVGEITLQFFMENNDKKASFFNSTYIKVFTEISAWIVGPVLISVLVGNYFDNKFNSAPWILGVALALSFTLSMIMIVKIAKKYEKDLNNKKSNDTK